MDPQTDADGRLRHLLSLQGLSRAQLETLAIVAYRQPITRPEIDDVFPNLWQERMIHAFRLGPLSRRGCEKPRAWTVKKPSWPPVASGCARS